MRLATDPPRSWDDVLNPSPWRDVHEPTGVGTMANDFAALAEMPWNHPAMPGQWFDWYFCWDKIKAEVESE